VAAALLVPRRKPLPETAIHSFLQIFNEIHDLEGFFVLWKKIKRSIAGTGAKPRIFLKYCDPTASFYGLVSQVIGCENLKKK